MQIPIVCFYLVFKDCFKPDEKAMKKTYLYYLPYLPLLFWSFYYLYCIVIGNLVFIHQPYALNVDEINDLSIIFKIQDSLSNASSFIQQFFITNPDPSHGFITYALPALVSYIPKLIWGPDIVIFIHRLCSALFLFMSLLIFSMAFIRGHYLRVLLFFFLMGIPYINVFSFWPRCESYLYFFLSLFLFLQLKTQFKTTFAYFFLAIAISARPAIVFFIPFFYILPFFLSQLFLESGSQKKKYILQVVVYSCLGVFLAQPHFILPSNILQFVTNHFELLKTETGVRDYINVNWWIDSIITVYFPIRFYLSSIVHFILWLSGFTFLLFFCFFSADIRKKFKSSKEKIIFWFTINLTSILSLLFVLFEVQVGIGWYLQLYFILIFVSSFWIISFLCQHYRLARYLFYPLLTIYCLCYFTQQFSWSPYFQMEYSLEEMMTRPKIPYHINLQNEYDKIKIILKKMSEGLGRRLHVRIMAEQYQLSSSAQYDIHPLWAPAPFYQFDKNLDAIIFYKNLYHPSNPENETKTGELFMRKESVHNYKKLVLPIHGGECKKDCFDAFPITNDLYLFYPTRIFENKKKLLQSIQSL